MNDPHVEKEYCECVDCLPLEVEQPYYDDWDEFIAADEIEYEVDSDIDFF